MVKKAATTENIQQKLALVVRSGKYKVGKYFIALAHPFRFQAGPEEPETRPLQAAGDCKQHARYQTHEPRIQRYSGWLEGAPLRRQQR